MSLVFSHGHFIQIYVCAGFSYSIRVMKEAKKFSKDRKPNNDDSKLTRQPSKLIKKIKGRNGKPDKIELLINIDLSTLSLAEEQVEDYKELFLLFDKNEDGLLTISQVCKAVAMLGISVSDHVVMNLLGEVNLLGDGYQDQSNPPEYLVQFSTFLLMMEKLLYKEKFIGMETMLDAVKIMDNDGDGFISVPEIVDFLTNFGDKMSADEVNSLIGSVARDNRGFVHCKGKDKIDSKIDTGFVQCYNGKLVLRTSPHQTHLTVCTMIDRLLKHFCGYNYRRHFPIPISNN